MDPNDQPKKIGLVWPLIIVLAVAIPTLAALLLIGNGEQQRADRIDAKVTILTVSVGLSLVIGATSLPIRQWRRGEEKPETVREVVKDGTQRIREIHYGAPPKYALGEPVMAEPMAFPALARAAYQAGALGGQRTEYAQAQRQMSPLEDWPDEALDGVNDVPATAGWDGEILQ